MVNRVVDIAEKFSPVLRALVAEGRRHLNDYEIKLVRIEGEFVWHTHDETDELFLVIDGTLTIQLRDGDVTLLPGAAVRGAAGVEHCPIADGEVQAMLSNPPGCATPATRVARTAAWDDSLAGLISPHPASVSVNHGTLVVAARCETS